MGVNHDDDRCGAVAYLAAYDVHRGKVFGRCNDTTGIHAFTRLVDQVMTQEPYKSADRVFWVVDNGSSHRGQAAIDRLAARYPNAIMVHTRCRRLGSTKSRDLPPTSDRPPRR